MVTKGKVAVKAHKNDSGNDKRNQNENGTDDRDQYDADEDNNDIIIDNKLKVSNQHRE